MSKTVFKASKGKVVIHGSRRSGKLAEVERKIKQHIAETPGARVAVFSKSGVRYLP